MLALLLALPAAAQDVFTFDELPPLPDPVGVAAPFAGVVGGELCVIGGANFPGGRPWGGHPKVWHANGYVFDGESWSDLPELCVPRAYGVSVTHGDSMVCAGGGDGEAHSREVFRIVREPDAWTRVPLPDLPSTVAYHCGVLVGDHLHLLGGLEAPGGERPLAAHWRLDLSKSDAQWESLDTWPGPPRMLAVAGSHDGALYLFGGVDLSEESVLPGKRVPLKDAYRWTEAAGWSVISPMPRAATAAPSPALTLGPHHLAIVGGDAGLIREAPAELKDEHPGFPGDVLVYSTLTNRWAAMGELPGQAPVTVPVVPYDDGFVIPSGEVRPGVRSPAVWSVKGRSRAGGFRTLDWTVLGLYLASLVGVGVIVSRRGKTTEDFFLAGRRIPWWAAGLSIFGTQLSAITFMAIPAKSYVTDWVYLPQNMGILLIAPLVVLVYLPLFRRQKITSAYEYLEQRFGLVTRLFGSASFILYQLGRMGVVLFLPALALEAATGLDVYLCIAMMGLLATVYTVMGGIEAVIWTDVLQVFVLVGGALCVIVLVAMGVPGGFGTLVEEASAAGKFRLADVSWDLARPTILVIALGAIFNNLVPYTTDQAVIQRFLTTPDEASARKAIWTNAWLSIPASLLFFGLGSALFVYYSHHPSEVNPAAPADQILPWFVATELPAGVAGLVIAGVFAAAMSSLDSSMNSIATAGVTDFYRRFREGASDAACLRLAKRLTVLLGAVGTGVAMVLASTDLKSLLDTFLSVVGLMGGTLGGLFALGLFTKRVNERAALVGAAVSVATLMTVWSTGVVSGLLFAAIGVMTTYVVGALTSLVLAAEPEGTP